LDILRELRFFPGFCCLIRLAILTILRELWN
jgi:hypothetical protein